MDCELMWFMYVTRNSYDEFLVVNTSDCKLRRWWCQDLARRAIDVVLPFIPPPSTHKFTSSASWSIAAAEISSSWPKRFNFSSLSSFLEGACLSQGIVEIIVIVLIPPPFRTTRTCTVCSMYDTILVGSSQELKLNQFQILHEVWTFKKV